MNFSNSLKTPLAVKKIVKYININGKNIAYNQSGNGTPIVFLHGNPTSSYLWRNITPHLESVASCFVFDLIGMGKSDKLDNSGPDSYKFEEHFHYINQAIEKVIPNEKITLVLHDWGSALGFHWAFQNQNRIEGIAYMEGIVKELFDNPFHVSDTLNSILVLKCPVESKSRTPIMKDKSDFLIWDNFFYCLIDVVKVFLEFIRIGT